MLRWLQGLNDSLSSIEDPPDTRNFVNPTKAIAYPIGPISTYANEESSRFEHDFKNDLNLF